MPDVGCDDGAASGIGNEHGGAGEVNSIHGTTCGPSKPSLADILHSHGLTGGVGSLNPYEGNPGGDSQSNMEVDEIDDEVLKSSTHVDLDPEPPLPGSGRGSTTHEKSSISSSSVQQSDCPMPLDYDKQDGCVEMNDTALKQLSSIQSGVKKTRSRLSRTRSHSREKNHVTGLESSPSGIKKRIAGQQTDAQISQSTQLGVNPTSCLKETTTTTTTASTSGKVRIKKPKPEESTLQVLEKLQAASAGSPMLPMITTVPTSKLTTTSNKRSTQNVVEPQAFNQPAKSQASASSSKLPTRRTSTTCKLKESIGSDSEPQPSSRSIEILSHRDNKLGEAETRVTTIVTSVKTSVKFTSGGIYKSKQSSGLQKMPTKQTEPPPSLEGLVWKRKKKAGASSSKQHGERTFLTKVAEPSSSLMMASQHHIKWDGLGESDYAVGYACCLCEQDLAVSPSSSSRGGRSEFANLPVASILTCGHSYHRDCLEVGKPDDQRGDPPCVVCMRADAE
ncbi:hypothetical protein Dimus_025785 [Dionaea muscipula]